MKALIYLSTFLFCLSSCYKKNDRIKDFTVQNLNLVYNGKNIHNITILSQFYGIDSLVVINIGNDEVTYLVKGIDKFLGTHSINNIVFKYSANSNQTQYSLLQDNINYTLYIDENEETAYLSYLDVIKQLPLNNNQNYELSDYLSAKEIDVFNQIIALYMEVTNSSFRRINDNNNNYYSISKLPLGGKKCARTIWSYQTTRSRSTSGVTRATNAFLSSHSDCHAIYGISTGCLWEDFLCASVQELECNGNTCNTMPWEVL